MWRQLSPVKHLVTLAIGITLSPGFLGAEDPTVTDELVVAELIVTLIDSVDVPAAETGIVSELSVREGQAVSTGQALGSLDDRQAKIEQSLTRTQLEVARWRAANDRSIDLAETQLGEQQQLAKQHEMMLEIAQQKAGNRVRVEASLKSEAVARNELDRATRARQEFVDSVSQSEIDGLRLFYEKTRLETRQADFERQLDELNAKAEVEAASGHTLGIERTKIERAQAATDHKIAELQVALQEQQSELAALTVAKHKITSPLDGVVVELFRKQGDWVTAGEPIVRVVRLNRLRAEGFVPMPMIASLRANRKVQLTINTGDESLLLRDGEIVFISPEINPVSHEVAFWVEFDNPKVDVLPGMRLKLSSKHMPDTEP